MGQPIELLITVLLFGSMWGPLYVAFKDFKTEPEGAAVGNYLVPKKLIGQSVVGLIAVTWIFLTYLFMLPPQVVAQSSIERVPLDSTVRVTFNKPIDPEEFRAVFTPEVQATVSFDDPYITRRLFKTVVITPSALLEPDTRYTVSLKGLKSVLGWRTDQQELSFTTEAIPTVSKFSLSNGATNVSACQPVIASLDGNLNKLAQFQFKTEPEVPLTVTEGVDSFEIKPTECFEQGQTYKLNAIRTLASELRAATEQETVIEVDFTTKPAPKIASFSPSSSGVPVTTNTLKLTFSEPMPQADTVAALTINPAVAGSWAWQDDKTVLYTATAALTPATKYTVTVPKGLADMAGGTLTEAVSLHFTTLGPVTASFSPKNGAKNVSAATSIIVTFDQGVDEASVLERLSITPTVSVQRSFDGNRLIIKPTSLAKDTTYTVKLNSGIKSKAGADSNKEFSTSFTTEESVTLLSIALDYQDKPLSCEVAALKMALGYKGVKVSENDLMVIVGYDPTVRNNGIWGDPDKAFVGDINGKQNSTGYGVHWDPIARAAKQYRDAEAFSNWTVQDAAAKLAAGHPIVIWGVQGRSRADSWQTPSGRTIKAYVGEHVTTLVGFRGTIENPTGFIINDPISGRLNWTTQQFKNNWATFNNSGVVVY